jgi:hypothetical protein
MAYTDYYHDIYQTNYGQPVGAFPGGGVTWAGATVTTPSGANSVIRGQFEFPLIF